MCRSAELTREFQIIDSQITRLKNRKPIEVVGDKFVTISEGLKARINEDGRLEFEGDVHNHRIFIDGFLVVAYKR